MLSRSEDGFGARTAGLATQAALNGHGAADIARQTGHRSLDTVLGYIRVATRFEGNVTAKIGL